MYRFCGKVEHVKDRCRYKKVKCFKYNQIGHLLFVSPKGENERKWRKECKGKERSKP